MGIAKSVGLSESQAAACMGDDKAMLVLNARVSRYAKVDHVDSTPTFVINGKAMDPGYHSLAELDAAIAQAQAGR
jgi:protein-disulfide isomerase